MVLNNNFDFLTLSGRTTPHNDDVFKLYLFILNFSINFVILTYFKEFVFLTHISDLSFRFLVVHSPTS